MRPLNAPDEPAHLQAIMEMRQTSSLPEIHFDFSKDPRGTVVGNPGSSRVRAYASEQGVDDPYLLIPYESMQPPLYYVAAASASTLLPDTAQNVLYIGRLIAAIFGAGTVYFAWAATKQFAPGSPLWAVATAALIALLPQFCFNSATAANDSAANFAATAAFYIWFRGLREPNYDRFLVKAGLLLGLATLAKLTVVALYPGLGLLLLFRLVNSWPGRMNASRFWKGAMLQVGGATAGVVAVCGWWLVRNIKAYGDPTGSLGSLKLYQARFFQANFADTALTHEFLTTTWLSSVGFFGWMQLRLADTLYFVTSIIVLFMLAITGYVFLKRRIVERSRTSHQSSTPLEIQMAAIMMIVSLTLFANYLIFNSTVAYQPQGRYLFPMLLPASLLITGGIYTWTWPPRLRFVLLSIPLVWFAIINVVGIITAAGPMIWP